MKPVCAECDGEIDPDAFASVVSDLRDVDGKPYHWSCAQEMFERERLANGEDS